MRGLKICEMKELGSYLKLKVKLVLFEYFIFTNQCQIFFRLVTK